MIETSAPTTESSVRFARIVAVGTIAAGLVVLLGWFAGIGILTSALHGKATMKPLTAASFIVLGAALWLRASSGLRASGWPVRRRLATILAAAAAVCGIATLVEWSFGLAIGIDTVLFPGAIAAAGDRYPGRMAHATALGLALIGVALSCAPSDHPRRRRVAQALVLTAALLGMLGLSGYAYDARSLYGFAAYASVSMPTAVLLVVLSVGVLAIEPSQGFLAPILSRQVGGVMARRLLPAVVVVPFVVGWLRLQGELAGWYTAPFGLALFATADVIIFAALTWWTASTLNRLDARRQGADAAARVALEESERRYRTLAESLPQLVWTCRPDGAWDYLSPQWVSYTGIPESEPLEYRWSASLYPDEVAGVMAQWSRAVQSGDPFDVEFRIRGADGQYRWFRALAVPVRDAGGRIVHWFGTNTDVDDRRRAENELQQLTATLEKRVHERTLELRAAKEQAESGDRLKTDFIMSMSHELRTPLNTIIGFTGTLLMRLPGALTGEQEQHLAIIQASARHLLLIISDLLDVARIEAGSLTLSCEPVDGGSVVREVIAELAPLAAQKGLRLSADVPPAPVWMQTDPRALKQVLGNLTSNGIKFTDQGEVAVTVREVVGSPSRRVEFAIADTGIGIAAGDQAKLFTKFGLLGAVGSHPLGGTGLGLYLSRRLTERMGGRIDVRSAPGGGSRFTAIFEDPS